MLSHQLDPFETCQDKIIWCNYTHLNIYIYFSLLLWSYLVEILTTFLHYWREQPPIALYFSKHPTNLENIRKIIIYFVWSMVWCIQAFTCVLCGKCYLNQPSSSYQMKNKHTIAITFSWDIDQGFFPPVHLTFINSEQNNLQLHCLW